MFPSAVGCAIDGDQILGGANLLAHEYHVQVCAVTDVASAKFTKRDDRQLVIPDEPCCKNETRFSQIRKFGGYGRRRSESHNLAQNDPQQLPLPIGSNRIEIVRVCA